MTDKKGEEITLILPSELKYLDLIYDLVSGISRIMGFNEAMTAHIKVAVSEAATNAIVYGNRSNKNKVLTLSFYKDETRLVIKVIDQGEGFAFTGIRCPVDPAHYLEERGRGIFIMKQYMDDVDFHFKPGKGMEVQLVKEVR